MPKLSKEEKDFIKSISKEELVKIVLKFASQKDFYDHLVINYFNIESGEEELFLDAKRRIEIILANSLGSTIYNLTKKFSPLTKIINEFTSVCKNKKLEADLMVVILDVIFEVHTEYFGTYRKNFDYKAALLVNRLHNLVTKHIHPDLAGDYKDRLKSYYIVLKTHSSFIDYVYSLNKRLELFIEND